MSFQRLPRKRVGKSEFFFRKSEFVTRNYCNLELFLPLPKNKTSNISQNIKHFTKVTTKIRKIFTRIPSREVLASQQIPGYNTSWFLIILNPEEPIPFNQELHELGIPSTQWYYWGSYRNPSKNCVNLCRNFCQNFCQVSIKCFVKCQVSNVLREVKITPNYNIMI